MAESNTVVSGGLAILLHVSRMAGLAPVTFVREKDGWRITRSRALRIYGNILITIIIFGNIVTMIGDGMFTPVFMITRNDAMMWILYSTVVMVIVAVSGYGSWSQMRTMMACLNKVHKINLGLNRQRQSRTSERRKIILLIFWMTVTLSLISFDMILLNIKSENIFSYEIRWMYIFFYILLGILVLQVMHIHLILHNVLYTFIIINDCLRDLLEVASIPTSANSRVIPPFVNQVTLQNNQTMSTNAVGVAGATPNPTKPNNEIVRGLTLAYTKICEVVHDMEKFYGKILFLLLGSIMTQLIVSPYLLIRLVLNEKYTIKTVTMYYIRVVLQMCWCIFHLVNLIVLIEPCHWTKYEIITTRGLVSHLMRYTNFIYEPLAVELEVFYRLLMMDQASYSPLKVTAMNRSLVIAILSSITTYLVILTQDQ